MVGSSDFGVNSLDEAGSQGSSLSQSIGNGGSWDIWGNAPMRTGAFGSRW